MSADILEYQVPFQQTVLFGSRWTPEETKRTALLLHGGGTSTSAGFLELRMFLNARGVETHAFDCVGHGRTGGAQLGTTLQERVKQVRAVVESQNIQSANLVLVGFSMGAYVAVKAATELGVARLCLAIPAAYATEAYHAPFGPAFSQILRTSRSWENSDAFELARDYPGHLLVISAEHDRIVPAEISDRYASASKYRASTVHHVINDAGHNLNEHFQRAPEARIAAYEEIYSLCRRSDA